MTRARTEDDLLEFKRLVRWLTGATLTQVDAEAELAAIEAKYGAAETVLVNVVVDGVIEPITLYADVRERREDGQSKSEPDWIPWFGSDRCPVAPWTRVEVKYADGQKVGGRASDFGWRMPGGAPGAIFAYRVFD